MIRPGNPTVRLAGPMSRRPLLFAAIALFAGALGVLGGLRFNVDSGQSLLVGSGSQAGQTYTSFSQSFGSDPIVMVLTARNPSAPYLERNLQRLGALEIDLAHDPRIASVLGPGAAAGSLRQAAVAEVNKVLTEYPYFVEESLTAAKVTALQAELQSGKITQAQFNQQIQQLQQQLAQNLQSDLTKYRTVLEGYILPAATDAHNARAAYKPKAGDRIIDSREKLVDAAVARDPMPPLFAEYLAGPGQQINTAAARAFFTRVVAAYGDCDDTLAALLGVQPSCQVFFERTLLDLPNCPPINSGRFCDPKPQWAAVLPKPQAGADSYQIVTVRVKAQYANDGAQLSGVQNMIMDYLAHGIGSDSYTHSLSSASLNNLKSLGPLNPTECGGATQQTNQPCFAAYHDARFATVIAGAPLLAQGVTDAMSGLLRILVPLAFFVMLLLLVGVFRVRGRVWPLVAAVFASLLTLGIALLTGTSITPAVLAGVPVLVGLGVDYAVQLVARYGEERSRGETVEPSIHAALANTGGATFVAALATLVGLGALLLVTHVDLGPLVAIPLVSDFAFVLCIGVVLAWLGALFIALPLAVASDRRRPIAGAPRQPQASAATPAARTLAIADNVRGVVAFAVVVALLGWVLLGRVPVQTDVQQLLAPSLPQLGNIETVQAQTGFTNEIDVYLHGTVVTGGLDTVTGNPLSVEWQCGAAASIRSDHADQVVQATSIGDYVIGAATGTASGSTPQCVPQNAPSPSPAPSPSISPSARGAAASPSAFRSTSPAAVMASRQITQDAASASPTPTAAASAPATPVASSTAGASPSPSPSTAATQTPFLCDLRLFPLLSRTLVMPIGTDTQACPPVDEYRQTFLAADATPIAPDAARIAIGVHSASVADEAKLVDGLGKELKNPTSGVTATPAGLAVLATTAYDNLVSRGYVLNLVPLLLVAVALFVVYRQPRRALLPLLPTTLAAGWAPLLLLLLGRLPGSVGQTLGSFNPLTVVMGSLVVALATEFGVVLLGRFYEERGRGLDPDAAAAAALSGVGRAIRVSALTLGAGFAVLALSGFLPNSLPLVADFGFVVVLDLALAVGAVFLVMLPAAVALERRNPLPLTPAPVLEAAPAPAPVAPQPAPVQRTPRARRRAATEAALTPETAAETATDPQDEPAAAPEPGPRPRRTPGVSGRKRTAASGDDAPVEEVPPAPRRPGVSGRQRRGKR